ncbi:MAG: TIGR01777 family oxidoreductase [Saprospiraceae bacterium]
MAKTILIGGGTGLVGTRLADMLTERGDAVRILSRRPEQVADYEAFAWDMRGQTIDAAAFSGTTHVVNLAGAGIADGRWTDERKKLIIDSREQSTGLLAKGISEHGQKVEAFISASAIGYYGNRGDGWMKESEDPGEGFLSESTIAWEKAIQAAADATPDVRSCWLRTGIALSPDGGALEKMLEPARFGVSGYFGNGEQWYSWVHIDDLARIYMAAIDDSAYTGAVNATSPIPVRNKHLAKVLAKAVDNPALALPVPAFGLKLVFGEMSHTILDSCRVSSQKLVDELGFDFAFPDVESALEDLLG